MDRQVEKENKNPVVVHCCAPGSVYVIFWGILLVLLGGVGLMSILVPTLHLGRYLLPAFLLVWGGYLLLTTLLRRV